MADEQNNLDEQNKPDEHDSSGNNSDTYSIGELFTSAESALAPAENPDIFAVKKENVGRLGSIIGMALSEGVFLCNAYRLDKRLSRDEMGETWQAADLHKSRNVIVSLPPPEIRKDETAIEPVRQNAKHTEALEHPRIVPVWECFTDPEHGFFTVRKLINGKNITLHWQDYVREHKKPAPLQVVKMLGDVAHALDYVHGVALIHGDLCPNNITVGLDGEVYLDNFALLPVHAESASAMRKPYLPPEVLEGNPATAAADIYALAVIAYELFSGSLPFSAEHEIPFPIPGVPGSVDAVLRKAMSKAPDDRYSSCGTFVKALEAGFREPPPLSLSKIKSPSKIKKPSPIKPSAVSVSPKRGSASSASLRAIMLLLGLFFGGAAACIVYDVGDVRMLIQNSLALLTPDSLPEPSDESVMELTNGNETEGDGMPEPLPIDEPDSDSVMEELPTEPVTIPANENGAEEMPCNADE